MTPATVLLWQAAGSPVQRGATPGVCCLCGVAAGGLPFAHWSKSHLWTMSRMPLFPRFSCLRSLVCRPSSALTRALSL